MVRRTTFLVLSLIAVLFLPFADCMSPMTQDQQSMQCCGSMPCDPSNQSHDCCKTMVSSQSASALPVAHASLFFPNLIPPSPVQLQHWPLSFSVSIFSFDPPPRFGCESIRRLTLVSRRQCGRSGE